MNKDFIDGLLCAITAVLILGFIICVCALFFDLEYEAVGEIISIQVSGDRWRVVHSATLVDGTVLRVGNSYRIGDIYYQKKLMLASWLR